MADVRLNSDLRNKYTEIENVVDVNERVVLTKNGYNSKVALSTKEYSRLADAVELALDEADQLADANSSRLSHEEVFGCSRERNT